MRSAWEYGNGPSGFRGTYLRTEGGAESILEANAVEKIDMDRNVVRVTKRGIGLELPESH